ncbi:MAG: phosphoribosylglycinamide formyltransferase [Ignavibacteria bacterium GWB2_35_12]|nr:MAG: phosphoribosylglycinamide formyltransferase [Ignavibacteria bacterium GWA2_35_8]OGU42691.1 MAG: phosphoribosylglycinamide formyltransferase [Ignavibacteria bacterium GWB2_35_12]OGU89372.1 MAG: phosphoribosylglycinamide formyltransferase [Ignavibacteria bacterium RIFOXYA2_FULL_35_10]OGV19293.1 MAG: phosphoribosylglycinamide formyltransferase [Ignavibacteria bacterium RIFOXYC2_FULL_35_21]
MPTLNLGFLASHGGSNMQAIINACKSGQVDANPCVVISNNSDSQALHRAKNEGIPYYHISTATHADGVDDAMIEAFEKHNVDVIILAGYMKKLGDKVINRFKGKILNIHPALLPKYGGKGMYGKFVHEAVLMAGEKVSGPTVHIVDIVYDHGRILAQKEVPVYPDDNVDTLSARVLEQEHILYPETIQKIANGEIVL